jgi:hypothetical protein
MVFRGGTFHSVLIGKISDSLPKDLTVSSPEDAARGQILPPVLARPEIPAKKLPPQPS